MTIIPHLLFYIIFVQGVRDLATLFPVLRDFIVDFMERNSQMIASEIGLNQLTEQVKRVILLHIAKSYYVKNMIILFQFEQDEYNFIFQFRPKRKNNISKYTIAA